MSAEPNPPLASTRAELRNLRNHSQATVAELKAFLRELKGRSPLEMLGMVAGNQLFRATVHALILITAALLVFTIIPYLTREAPTAAQAPVPVTAEAAPASPPVEPTVPAQADPIETLGIGEEKTAPRDVNPLDTGTGSFLEELE